MLNTIQGTFIVAQTPFDERGNVDFHSIDSLVDFYLGHGADGLTVLGVSGEASRLSAEEAKEVAKRFILRAQSKPVIVGVTNASLVELAGLAHAAMDFGAAGVMIAPPGGQRTESDVFSYFEVVFSAIGKTPTVLQDYPGATGVAMSTGTIGALIESFEQIEVLKHEDMPGLSKLTKLRRDAKRRIAILTGSNALYLPYELDRGADGPMAGFSFPEMLVNVYRLFKSGKRDQALDLYNCYLPLLRYEAQGVWGVAVRKEILRRRGAIRSATLRRPGPALDEIDHREIEETLHRLAVLLGRSVECQ